LGTKFPDGFRETRLVDGREAFQAGADFFKKSFEDFPIDQTLVQKSPHIQCIAPMPALQLGELLAVKIPPARDRLSNRDRYFSRQPKSKAVAPPVK